MPLSKALNPTCSCKSLWIRVSDKWLKCKCNNNTKEQEPNRRKAFVLLFLTTGLLLLSQTGSESICCYLNGFGREYDVGWVTVVLGTVRKPVGTRSVAGMGTLSPRQFRKEQNALQLQTFNPKAWEQWQAGKCRTTMHALTLHSCKGTTLYSTVATWTCTVASSTWLPWQRQPAER